ncbi:hypothetical protein SCE1572_08655 [Sorangium cellulosum So0157-2]|uniref:Uncharacterized protein n=1 Tax=Sorangium cellulosum So0157-2 TaxID=1254432 RepID=S4XQ82_SORCE|nr:hypothetical protein SCE1572_08655 [Sorangium cellulosum So0157-2]
MRSVFFPELPEDAVGCGDAGGAGAGACAWPPPGTGPAPAAAGGLGLGAEEQPNAAIEPAAAVSERKWRREEGMKRFYPIAPSRPR